MDPFDDTHVQLVHALPAPYLQHKLVGLAEFARVFSELLVLFHLLCIRSIEQQLFDVSWLQPISGHIHQHLAQLPRRQLQVSDQDG